MITRELLKAEIDKVQDSYLDVLYRIIKALGNSELPLTETGEAQLSNWSNFIEQTYGSFADEPLERGDQGQYEVREPLA
jgi:hypothetical protein